MPLRIPARLQEAPIETINLSKHSLASRDQFLSYFGRTEGGVVRSNRRIPRRPSSEERRLRTAAVDIPDLSRTYERTQLSSGRTDFQFSRSHMRDV